MELFGRILQTPEEVDAGVFHFPLTRHGTLLVFFVQTFVLIMLIGGFEICETVGSCNRSTWNEDHWGAFSEPGWCEKSRPDRMVGEPMNAYSNFWFCYCGSWICVFGVADYLRTRGRTDNDTPRNHLLAAPYLSKRLLVCSIFRDLTVCRFLLWLWVVVRRARVVFLSLFHDELYVDAGLVGCRRSACQYRISIHVAVF